MPGKAKSARSKASTTAPADAAPLTLHVVSHTHWDREWYLTYQQFRMRLVEVVDNVLHLLDTDPEFRYFHLDGQTIVLEDYLQIRPQNETRLREHIASGRLLVGPWYQLMDEYLVSGESIVRSLLVGSRLATDFGGRMPVGYLADQFGNISQMPQILRGFGLDNCVFGRGLQLAPGRQVEFRWRGPDGSEVLCSLMAWWYNNAQRIPAGQEGEEYLQRLVETMTPHCGTSHLLLMNGVDHLDVQEDISAVIQELQAALPGAVVQHSTMPEYIAAVRNAARPDLPVYEGEMREDRHGSVLAGVLSTRLYLKTANSRCEALLERTAEPLAAIGWLLGQGYDRDFFNYAWKRLMWNHPHDSICGCSIDQVHREMEPRFDEVQQVGEELASRALHGLAASVAAETPALLVFNSLGFERSDLVTAAVDFPLGPPTREGRRPAEDSAVAHFTLWDDEDVEVAYQVRDVEVLPQTVLSPVELPLVQWVKRFTIRFIATDVPSMGYRTFQVDPTRAPSPPTESLVPYTNALENDSLLVEIETDGTLHILQKATEQDYEGLHAFQDGGDCGDEYHYRAPVRDEVICTSRAAAARVTLLEAGPVVASYRVELELPLPGQLSSDGRGRSAHRAITHISSVVSLSACASRVEIETTIENRSRDHRLRALFPTGTGASEAWAEGQFDVIGRPSRPPQDWPGAAPTQPQQSFVDVSSGADGLCVLNRGLTEYELLDDGDQTLAITLLRCVGRLSGTGDGPQFRTPDAQCLGKNEAAYALYPHAGTWEDARAWQEGHAFRTPLRCVQLGTAYNGELVTLQRQAVRQGRPMPPADAPLRHSFLSVSPDTIVLSALKLAEERDSLVVRLLNIGTEAQEVIVKAGFDIAEAWVLNLEESRESTLSPVGDRAFALDLRPKQLATIELLPA